MARGDTESAFRSAATGGRGGRGHDALRDLVTPAMGMPPVIRVAAPLRDGTEAYERVRERLAHLRG
ncbi:hypothetical protein GCM10028772_31050 [Nocardioides ultimimeridianus]